jgi:DNA-binding transcriptional ArsR family regulator
MLAKLTAGRRPISHFANSAAMTFAAVSRHLKVLEEAGLVTREIAGREHYFAANPKALDSAEAWIAEQSARWQQSLETLKTIIESETETEMTTENPLVAKAEIHINAPADRVFAAWTDPKTAARFMGSDHTKTTGIRIDPQPGGELYIPLAAGVVGGSVTALAVTFFLLPSAYMQMEERAERQVGRSAGGPVAP